MGGTASKNASEVTRMVGEGNYGWFVVQHKKSKKLYALKEVDKKKCVRCGAVAGIIQDRRLLEEDDDNCFFVLDLMLGGDLKYHLDTKGHFPESVVRFWAAELASGLVYLHSKGIMHRNINSWNILLDAKGHAALTDLQTATHYSQDRMHTSVVGLIGHMAPEMVDEKRPGYSWQVDWWSLGVCLFELLWNQYPFQKLRDDIMTLPITIPSQSHGAVSSECTAALLGLLERDPKKRLGCRTGSSSIEEIQSHGWFLQFDWEKLQTKQLDPPFAPNPDGQNFMQFCACDFYTGDPNLEKKKPEFRQLESDFTVFDFERTSRRSYDESLPAKL
ncbi:kinase-like domain-containing protein [Russula vinacea]|nr:kinase-like domain-containing protein [Russula vinacea]